MIVLFADRSTTGMARRALHPSTIVFRRVCPDPTGRVIVVCIEGKLLGSVERATTLEVRRGEFRHVSARHFHVPVGIGGPIRD